MKRKRRTAAQKRILLKKQKGYCFYCGQAFGEMAWYKKPVILRPEYEHIAAFSITENDEDDNIVISCQVCNIIKSGRLFPSFYELIEYIQKKWIQHGEMTLCRKATPRAVEIIQAMHIIYGQNVGDWPKLTDSQVKWIRQVIRESKRSLR